MANAKAARPRDLVMQAGRIPAAALTVVLIAASAADAQSKNASPTTPAAAGGPAPWQVKSDPALATSKAGAPAQPGAAQPAPRDPTRPAPSSGPAGEGDKARVKVSEHMTVDLHVKDESVNNVLELLSIQSQKNIIASKNVSGKVSADLFNVTFYEALDAILHVNGFQYIEKGNFIYVYTREEFLEIQKALSKRVAKVMRLNYLNATDAELFVKPLLSQGGDTKVTAKTPDFNIGSDTPVGKDDFALGAVLVVIDYEENINAIEKLLVELDTRPQQVLVEATILETRVSEANSFGIDFSVIGDLDFVDFINAGGARKAADAIIRGGTGASATSGVSPLDNAGGAISSTAGNTQDGKASVKIGVIAGPVGVFLRALDDVSDFTVLSSPKLLALNRMPSRVLVGQRVGYLNTTATETSTTQTVQFLDTGTQLFFRPFVSNTGEIRMELKPKVASATIRNAGNGQGGTVSIPDETTQEVTTNVIVKDGNTIVLGGLFVERTDSFRTQVPVFGDIPLIGAAFRGHDDSTDRRELIFLIRPSIVNETTLAMQGLDMKNEIERHRAGQRQGLLPWSREKMTSVLNVEAEAAARSGDTEEALWKIQRSLSLNPRQPDALRLREKITGEQERWPANFTLDGIVSGEINRKLDAIPAAPGSKHLTPHGSVDIHREKMGPGARRTEVEAPVDAAAAQPAGEALQPGFDGPSDDQPEQPSITAEAGESQASAQPFLPGAVELPGADTFPLVSAESASKSVQPAFAQSDAGLPAGDAMASQSLFAGAGPESTVGAGEPDQPLTLTVDASSKHGSAGAFPTDPTSSSLTPGQPGGGAEQAAPQQAQAGAKPGSGGGSSLWAFFRALFFGNGGGTQPQPTTVVEVPADAPQQQQELSK